MLEALWVSKEYGLNRFISEQPPYHILDRRVERELIRMAQPFSLGILLWSLMAGGLLTGKYQRNGDMDPDSRYVRHPAAKLRMVDDVYRVAVSLGPHVRQEGCTMAQFALAWLIHQPGITSAIIGPRTLQQLQDNLGALDVDITAEDRQLVDELVPPGTMVSPFYQANFGPGKFRW